MNHLFISVIFAPTARIFSKSAFITRTISACKMHVGMPTFPLKFSDVDGDMNLGKRILGVNRKTSWELDLYPAYRNYTFTMVDLQNTFCLLAK